MSGIAGIFHRDFSPIPGELLHRQSEALNHRGPISFDIKPQEYVGFVHRRHANQTNIFGNEAEIFARNGLTVISDARIDNREELYSSLHINYKTLTQISDNELILSAYEKWGKESTQKLLGDFSFVIFDSTKRQLFCGRDHFGVKPFYYFFNHHQFIFGSEIKSILIDPSIPVLLNEEKIADFLLELFEDKARTFYQGIFRLPPAHNLVIDQENIIIERYWQLDPTREIRLNTDQEYAEAYKELFIDAVRSRIVGEHSAGSMLSGGLDSSSVTCVAERILNQDALTPLHTYSSIFDSVPQSDESNFIQTVLDHGSFEPNFIQGDQLNPIRDIRNIIEIQDEPSYAPQLFLNRGIWAAGKQAGTQVLLEGLMGDNVVSHGYAYLSQLAREWKWKSLHKQLFLLAKNHENPLPLNQIMSFYVWEYGIKSWVPDRAKIAWRSFRGRPNSANSTALPAYINSDFAERIHLKNRLQEQYYVETQTRSTRQRHLLDLENGLIPTALEIYNVEISRFGMEARFPFLDRRLAEYCLAIPPEQKINHGYTRWIARRAMSQYLPEQIRTRTSKGNLGWNFMRGIKADSSLIEQILDESGHEMDNFLDRNILNNSLVHIRAGNGVESDAMLVFLSTVLVVWMNSRSFSNI